MKAESKNISLSWKKSSSEGVLIPHKMKKCSDCKNDSLCDRCDKLVNQKKKFSANLNELSKKSAIAHENGFKFSQ